MVARFAFRLFVKINFIFSSKCINLICSFCSRVRYNAHLYCLVVQAGFYGEAVKCWIFLRGGLRVRSSVGAKDD